MNSSPSPAADPASPVDAPLEVGREVELRIDALAAGGDGVGRAGDGRVVFVPMTAPGDRVRARVTALQPRFARAELVAVLAGGARVEPRCEVYGRCGGCAWQHVAYAAQCEAKGRIVEDALRRIAHLQPAGPVPVVPSPAIYGYRRRARVICRDGRVGYRRRRSHEVVAAPGCPILAEPLEERLRALAASPPQHDGEWDLAALEGDGRSAPRGAAGAPLEMGVEGDRLRISAGVFFQANADLHAALVRAVAGAAGEGRRLVELYAGAGFLTLSLARAFRSAVAVESSPAAAADLRRNLRSAGLSGVRVLRAPAEVALDRALLRRPPPDAVVLDPPRTGLPRGAAVRLAGLGAERIVYLSCDPATLARDLALLVREGYALGDVSAFDLFPQTPHVEVLAVVRRERGPQPGGAVH